MQLRAAHLRVEAGCVAHAGSRAPGRHGGGCGGEQLLQQGRRRHQGFHRRRAARRIHRRARRAAVLAPAARARFGGCGGGCAQAVAYPVLQPAARGQEVAFCSGTCMQAQRRCASDGLCCCGGVRPVRFRKYPLNGRSPRQH